MENLPCLLLGSYSKKWIILHLFSLGSTQLLARQHLFAVWSLACSLQKAFYEAGVCCFCTD
jgi:hypothetical protein